MFKSANGRPTRILAGLHFAGEGSGDPNEHAVACYARSVFEKLEISPTPPAVPVDHVEAVASAATTEIFSARAWRPQP